jgi:conjugative transfer signal peptidase TraF
MLAGSLLLLGIAAAASELLANRQVVINTSPSVMPGLYVRSDEVPAVGRIVDFRIPRLARAYVRQRSGDDGAGWYILKPIVAGPGDRVDTTGKWLKINGRPIAPIEEADGAGRLLPHWRKSRVLSQDEFFVFSNRIPNSFDSRYYGPIRRNQIAAVRIALMTW